MSVWRRAPPSGVKLEPAAGPRVAWPKLAAPTLDPHNKKQQTAQRDNSGSRTRRRHHQHHQHHQRQVRSTHGFAVVAENRVKAPCRQRLYACRAASYYATATDAAVGADNTVDAASN
jgi:hypothetical protein